MEKDDVLRLLLAAADDLGCEFDYTEIARWPAGTVQLFETLGLLRAAPGGLFAPCPSCDDGHVEAVTIRTGPQGRRRFFIRCPEDLRVEVSSDMCCGWEIDPGGLARAVVGAMDLKGSPKVIVPDRLWRLGRIPWSGKTREILLAVRLRDEDAATVARRVPPGGRSIVLVPHHVPDVHTWPRRVPATVALSGFASIDNDQLVIDGVALLESVGDADDAIADRAEVPLDAVAAKKVAKHVKSTIESMVTNEALVQAYRVNGSYRKAATALNEDGYVTDRWAVERAVKAAGGPEAVVEMEDSSSVARTVASQPRDRAKKVSKYRN